MKIQDISLEDFEKACEQVRFCIIEDKTTLGTLWLVKCALITCHLSSSYHISVYKDKADESKNIISVNDDEGKTYNLVLQDIPNVTYDEATIFLLIQQLLRLNIYHMEIYKDSEDGLYDIKNKYFIEV
jgi:hypothetical protein